LLAGSHNDTNLRYTNVEVNVFHHRSYVLMYSNSKFLMASISQGHDNTLDSIEHGRRYISYIENEI